MKVKISLPKFRRVRWKGWQNLFEKFFIFFCKIILKSVKLKWQCISSVCAKLK
jgi:hypothetical protein